MSSRRDRRFRKSRNRSSDHGVCRYPTVHDGHRSTDRSQRDEPVKSDENRDRVIRPPVPRGTLDRMGAKREPMIDESVVRSICDVLGRTHGGLKNKEIDELLAACRIHDPTPAPTQYCSVHS